MVNRCNVILRLYAHIVMLIYSLTDAPDVPNHSIIEDANTFVGSTIKMVCSLKRDGNPASNKYSWYHNTE